MGFSYVKRDDPWETKRPVHNMAGTDAETPQPQKVRTRTGPSLAYRITQIFVGFIFVAGLLVMLYPTISDKWNSYVNSQKATTYDELITSDAYTGDLTEMYKAAQEYNMELASGGFHVGDYEASEKDMRYESLLNVDGNGMMGYIEIPKINITVPIAHYATEDVLETNIGHIPGTSLPVGGPGTHCLISGHRGLPSAKLFSDLDKMEIGDTFQIHVLGRTLWYQVDDIQTVLPEEVSGLKITSGKDQITMITCTPYGINTHRLLVRGTRISGPEEVQTETEEITWEALSKSRPVLALILILIVILLAVIAIKFVDGRQR